MQRFSILSIAGLCLLLIFSSCRNELSGGAGSMLNLIPNNAVSVTEIDLPALMEKADFEAVKEMPFYQDMVEEARRDNPVWAEVLADPYTSGVDLDQKIYIANIMDEKNMNNTLTTIALPLADDAAFSNLLAKANVEEEKNIEGFSYHPLDRNSALAWDGKMVILVNSSGTSRVEKGFRQILETTPGNSIAQDKDLLKILGKNHDINSWFSTNPFAANKDFTFYTSFLKLEADDLKDNYIHSYIDFEKGEINGSSDFRLSPKLGEEIDLFMKDELDTKVDKLIPGDELVYVTSMALNFEGINTFISRSNMAKNFVNFSLNEYGLDLDQLAETFEGDLTIAAYNGSSKNEADGLVLLKLHSEKKFETILDIAASNGVLSKIEGSRYAVGYQSFSPNFTTPFGSRSQLKTEGELLVKDDMVYISSAPSIIDQIESGKFSPASKKGWAKDVLRSSSFSTFIDFKNILALGNDWDGEGLDNLKIYTKDGRSTIQLRMEDQSKNSLKNIFELMNESYLRNDSKYN